MCGIGNNNSYLHKTGAASNGGIQLSRDPLNLTNKHSRKVRYDITIPDYGGGYDFFL